MGRGLTGKEVGESRGKLSQNGTFSAGISRWNITGAIATNVTIMVTIVSCVVNGGKTETKTPARGLALSQQQTEISSCRIFSASYAEYHG